MKMVYVLSETDCECGLVIGVLDHSLPTIDELKGYYGDRCEILDTRQIEDSGIEWYIYIKYDGNETATLLTQSYTLNKF